jgi:hypothetical protein
MFEQFLPMYQMWRDARMSREGLAVRMMGCGGIGV